MSSVQTSALIGKIRHKVETASVTELILLVASSSYIMGLIITNIHLAYFGAVTVELVRFRYISTGFLFLAYVGLAGLLHYGLTRLQKDHLAKNTAGLIWECLTYLGSTFVASLASGLLLNYIVGAAVPSPVSVPDIFDMELWWKVNAKGVYGLAILFGSILLYLLIRYITNRLKRPPSKQWLAKAFPEITWYLVFVSFIALIYFSTTIPSLLPGWLRFTMGAYVVFFIVFLWRLIPITFRWIREVIKAKPPSVPAIFGPRHVISEIASNAVWILVLPLGMFLNYERVIYPTLPQQLGGGSIIPVTARATTDKLSNLLATPGYSLYVVDRTSDDTIFQLLPTTSSLITSTAQITTTTQVTATLVPTLIQVANSDIESLTYTGR